MGVDSGLTGMDDGKLNNEKLENPQNNLEGTPDDLYVLEDGEE